MFKPKIAFLYQKMQFQTIYLRLRHHHEVTDLPMILASHIGVIVNDANWHWYLEWFQKRLAQTLFITNSLVA